MKSLDVTLSYLSICFVLPGQSPSVTVTLSMAMSLVNDDPVIPSKVNWENRLTLLIDIDAMRDSNTLLEI